MSLQSLSKGGPGQWLYFFTTIYQIIDRLLYIKKLTMMPFR